MKKLTEMQRHKLREANKNASDVLRELKAQELKGKALDRMKALEEAVGNIEVVLLT